MCAMALSLGGCDALTLSERAPETEDDLRLSATARRGGWRYAYPDLGIAYEGRPPSAADPVGIGLVAPLARRTVVGLTAEDGIYGFALPALGLRGDAIPGRIAELWFVAERPGLYEGACAEPCGQGAAAEMRFAAAVVSGEAFEGWAACAARRTGASPGGVAPAERMAECAALLGAPAPQR